MPGTSLVYGTKLVENSIQDLKLEDNYIVDKILDTDRLGLVKSGFDGYPFTHIEDTQFTVLIEGMIYNIDKSELVDKITSIAQSYIHSENHADQVRKLVENAFGEFLVTIYFKDTGDVLLFNDRWGRLPCFIFSDSEKSVISREPKFILHYLTQIRYNKFSIIEYIALRYTMGDRTFFKDIERLRPGYLITISSETLLRDEIVPLHFKLDDNLNQSKSYYISKSKEILLDNTEQILRTLNQFKSITVDISGGYDSRLVLAALSKFDKSIIPNTVYLTTGDESETAFDVTESLGLELMNIVPERKFDLEEIQHTLFMTDAFVNGLTTYSCYEDKQVLLQKMDQPIANFQGFGGEFLRHPLHHKKHFKNMIDVIENDVLSSKVIQACSMILDVSIDELYRYWMNFFDSSYSEEKMRDRVMHYYYDYYRFLVMEGEDRTRLHVWPISPMMSWLKMSANSFPRNMANFDFFEQLILAVEPKVSVKRIPIWDTAIWRSGLFKIIDGSKFASKFGLFLLSIKWKRGARKSSMRRLLEEKALELYGSTKSIQNIFRRDMVVQFTKEVYGPGNRYLWQLLSLFMYMNSIEEKFS